MKKSHIHLLTLTLFLTLLRFPIQITVAQTTCTFTPQTDIPIGLWATPLGGANNAVMQPNIPYTVLRGATLETSLLAYEVEIDAEITGWFERGLLGEFSDDCELGAIQQLTIADFPEACIATVTQDSALFTSSFLTEVGSYYVGYPGGGTYLEYVIGISFITINSTAISALEYAGGHGWAVGAIASHHLEFDPDCPEKTFITTITAQSLDGARIWSNPHVDFGTVTADLPVNTVLEVMAGPVTSIISRDGITEGEWYLIRHDIYGTGWVWAEMLNLSTPFPPETIGSALVTDNTRVWSQPSVLDGDYLGDMPENTRVNLLDGPIDGTIRTDTDDIGQWYWIQTRDRTITGWVWAGRLDIQPQTND